MVFLRRSLRLSRGELGAWIISMVISGALIVVCQVYLSQDKAAIVTSLAITGGMVLVLVVARPVLGIAMIMFHAYSLLPNFYLWGSITIRTVLVGFTVMGILLRDVFLKEKVDVRGLLKNGSFYWLITYYLWAVGTMVFFGAPMDDAQGMINNIIFFALVFMVSNKANDIRLLVVSAFLGCVLVSALGWVEFLKSPVWTYPIKRIDGIYGNEIVMALHSFMGACFGVGLLAGIGGRVGRFLMWVGIAVCAGMTMSAASRGVTVAAIVLGVASLSSRGVRARWAVPLAMAVGVMGVWVAWDPIVSALDAWRNVANNVYRAGELSSGRIYLYQAAVRLLIEHPEAWLVGIGWGRFKYMWFTVVQAPIVDANGVPRLNVHCSYLQVLVEVGLVGMVLYVIWTVSYMRELRRALSEREWWPVWMKSLTRGILLAIVALLLHSVVDNDGRGNDRAHVGAVAVGVAAVSVAKRRSRKKRMEGTGE